MASLVFDPQGNLTDIQQFGPDAAYIGTQPVPIITGSQLRQYAAIIYAEAASAGIVREINPSDPNGEMFRETVSIAIAMYNYTRAKGTAFYRAGKMYGLQDLVQDTNYVKGINSPAYQEYFSTSGDNNRRRLATLSVIKLFTRQIDDIRHILTALNGAQYWDGHDLFRRFPNHYRARLGFELGNPQHGHLYEHVSLVQGAQILPSCPAQDPNVAARRRYTFLSTTTAGGSIFFRIHPEAAAQGISW